MLSFLHPSLLWSLALLPLLALLLRLLPPSPRKIRFPPFFFLEALSRRTPPPATPPWWLMLLRLLLLSTLIAGFAGPVWRATATDPTGADPSPILLVIDNSWSAAGDWSARQILLQRFCDDAQERKQSIAWLATAEPEPRATAALPPSVGCAAIAGLKPRPWPNDAASLESALNAARQIDPMREIKWLAAPILAEAERHDLEKLAAEGHLRLLTMARARGAVWFAQAPDNSAEIKLFVRRTDAREREAFHIDALDDRENAIAGEIVDFVPGQKVASVALDLNPALRNRIRRIEIKHETTAAAVLLLDDGARRGSVGVIGEEHEADRASDPLFSESFYLTRALSGTAATVTAPLGQLLDGAPDLVIWPGSALLTPGERDGLARWVRQGGTLLRFAGASTLNDETANGGGDDPLLPERMIDPERMSSLRTSGIGIAPFSSDSPFAATPPPTDLSVRKQALLEPPANGSDRIWATLEDGTPLVSTASIDKGLLIFVHVPASPSWSTLPFSPFFLDLLNHSLKAAMADGHGARQASGGDGDEPLSLAAAIDGFGRLQSVSPDEQPQPLSAKDLRTMAPSARAPPGLYRAGHDVIARNLGPLLDPETLVASEELDLPREDVKALRNSRPLGGFALTAAFALLLIDWMAFLVVRGNLRPSLRKTVLSVGALLLLAALYAAPARAADSTAIWIGAMAPAGVAADANTLSGLAELARTATIRTNIEDIRSESVDPETADLALYALLYWRLADGTPSLSDKAIARLRDYMANGGMLVIDFADGGQSASSLARAMLAARLALPPLIRADANSTIAHSYYLLPAFSGRFDRRPLWIEKDPPVAHDGTSRILVGDADWATAWMPDSTDIEPERREQAMRFGINLLMYALTGNYKSDQIHIKALLEKLGKNPGQAAPAPAGGAP